MAPAAMVALGELAEAAAVVALAKPPAKPSEFGPPKTALELAAAVDAAEPAAAQAPPAIMTDITEANRIFFMLYYPSKGDCDDRRVSPASTHST